LISLVVAAWDAGVEAVFKLLAGVADDAIAHLYKFSFKSGEVIEASGYCAAEAFVHTFGVNAEAIAALESYEGRS
jgi:hypothetical protein